MSLMVSISGIRGIVGDDLTPEVIVKYASAFAEYCQLGKIVIGRDGRSTGKIIANLASSTLLSMGCDVVALGIAPTPTIAIAVAQLHAAGGISITASHNPIPWNGLKFFGSTGMFLNGEENREFWGIAETDEHRYKPWNNIGNYLLDDSFIRQHIDMVMNLPYLKPETIRRRHFRVVVDCINASGGLIVPSLLRELGCEVIEMNCEVSGVFTRTPEPLPENLGELSARVVAEQADFGVAVDPDVDRLVFITERGEPFGEEYTIASAVKFVLEHDRSHHQDTPASVVVNLSTTRAVDDIAQERKARVYRTPVGEINVVQKMREIGAVIGGEGSGGVILPAMHYGRDAVVGIGLILQELAEFGGPLSSFRSTLPHYEIRKSKIDLSKVGAEKIFSSLGQHYGANGNIDTRDGLKINFADSWVHLRTSNTEPILRIIAEAPSANRAEDLIRQFRKEILSL